jgi:DNA polymerase III epsilon subunit-like protein
VPPSPDGSSKIYPNTSNTPGTISEEDVKLTAPVVVAKTSTALDSLTSKLGSSLHISAPQQSVIRESPSAPEASKQGKFVEEQAFVEFIPQNLAGRKSEAPTRKAKATKKWTVIPEQQQYNALAALRLRCHPPAVLKASGYTLYTNRINLIGDDAVLAPLEASAYHRGISKRTAIALDCEMVGVGDKNESEIARISAIDYLTGEILIDTLVQPTQFVTDWRTKFSGITKEAMSTAILQGRTLQGWPVARALLFEYIDADTVLIGQALHFDLIALGIQHQRVVDSAILASEAVGHGVKRRWGLKDLCDQLLDIKIQKDGQVGHDSVEDAFAAREMVLWCINHPSALSRWGKKRRNEYYSKQKKPRPKTGPNTVTRRQHPSYLGVGLYDHEDELIWSDVAGDCGDRNYDPWSD